MANSALAPGALAKPYKGQSRDEQLDARASERTERLKAKAESKKRDGQKCRWPHVCRKPIRLESAHLVNLSQGGADTTDNLITLCFEVHQGKTSLHSQDRKIEPLTNKGCDGPVAFYQISESGQWKHIASERSVGISEARR
ncbi:HNH endonuclease [Gemmatimonas sp.]|uniref:HNH endonuclease n=1 Tax=Gemmatimonas sp. TaxID=1962908 RepID=UPI0027B97EAF|nr:HNH endonuclease [Gemmatimonas sp.]